MRKVDRILVIDDDVELCSLVGEYLEPEGFQIEAVHDGNRGLERALTGSPAGGVGCDVAPHEWF
jgi:DNA-binding response OmpR family regulator